MSIWSPGEMEAAEENQSDHVTNITRKTYKKVDATSKLQIIQALDNGQLKADLAKEYGVHPQTITAIYKQRETIIKKYAQKYNLIKEVCSLNLEQNLLDWFDHQFQSGNSVTEKQLHEKAKDILKDVSEDFSSLNDWLQSFCTRHNISKYTSDNSISEKVKEEWRKFLKDSDLSDIYFGSVCAIAHNYDYSSYLDSQQVDSYVSVLSVFNTLGTDKREAAVVGKELLETETPVKSLPVNYYYCAKSQVNYSVILRYLTKWENELATKGNVVTLVLNIPENLIKNLHFEHIRIRNMANFEYVGNILEKVVECFTYHYQTLQVHRNLTYGKDNTTFVDYLHMVGTAWYNVPQKYIQSLCHPPEDGCLFYNMKQDHLSEDSMSQLCKLYNVSLEQSQSIEKFMFYDKKLPCICEQIDESLQPAELLSQRDCQPTSGMEAYQAMKRLVSYIQGENAGGSLIKYAKYLENHLEYGALLQMHQIIASTNENI